MSVQMIGNGGFGITGEKDIALYRLLALRSRLKMEVKGLRFSGRSTSAILKDEFGWKGTKQKILEQLEKHIEQLKEERAKKE